MRRAGGGSEVRRLGYARVATPAEPLDDQLVRLREEGCALVFSENESAARFSRQELRSMLKTVRPGDQVLVTRIDRLARSPVDLFAIVNRIVQAGASFRSLAEPWTDTGSQTGRLMLNVLGALAEVDRDLLRTRLAEGKRRARARGQHMGRYPALTPEQQHEARRRRAEGASLAELAERYNVSKATISRLGRES